MKNSVAPTAGPYRSPLRAAQAAQTRDRILEALGRLIELGQEPTYLAIANAAEVQERTVYRHFPAKGDLFAAFWERMNGELVEAGGKVGDLPALASFAADCFADFSRNEALVRAMLHSPHGRAIRIGNNRQRRQRFERVAATELPDCDPATRRRAAAAAQVLCSAMAWECLRDYWQLDAAQAAEVVRQGLTAMFAGLASTSKRTTRTVMGGPQRPSHSKKEKP